jgi:hypothetical protein
MCLSPAIEQASNYVNVPCFGVTQNIKYLIFVMFPKACTLDRVGRK